MSTSERKEKKDNKKGILLIFIVLLALLNIVLLYLMITGGQKATADKEEALALQKQVYEQKLEKMELQLKEKIREAETLIKDKSAREAFLDSLQAELQQVSAERDGLKSKTTLDAKDIAYYKEKIETYEYLLNKKDSLITYHKEVAQINLDNYRKAVDDKNKIERENVDLQEEIRKTEGKLDEAGALRTESIRINILKRNGKEESGGKYRARDISGIRVYATIAPNNAAKAGGKDLLLRVIEPSGTVFHNPVGSGYFQIGNKRAPYSAKQNILYDGSAKSISFDFKISKQYKTGRYKVELYTDDGNKLGETSFQVR